MNPHEYRQLLMDLLHLDDDSWQPTLNLYDDLGIDSLALVRIATELAAATSDEGLAVRALHAETVGALQDMYPAARP